MNFVIIISALLLTWSGIIDADYIFTTPSTLRLGTAEQLSLTLYNVKSAGKVVVDLLDSKNATYATATQAYTPSAKPELGDIITILFTVAPGYTEPTATLRITGTFGGVVTITNSTTVGVQSTSERVFIQSDKPIYKAGQEIKFRVLVTNYLLKPVGPDVTFDVWVQNEAGTRLNQWLKQKFDKPILQFSMLLSSQPTLGQWSINVNTSSGTMGQQFVIIQEYVLPKFEVTITPPPYVLRTDASFTVNICGKYTYGEPVVGNVLAVASVTQQYYYYIGPNDPVVVLPSQTEQNAIKGCYDFVVKESSLHWKNSTYYYSYNVQINATITEEGTGITSNASTTISFSQSPVTINFPSTQQYYKPGFPYYGSLVVTNPDNSPRPKEAIQVCVQADNFPKNKGCKNYTSGTDGSVKFSFLTVGDGTKSITVAVTAVNFPKSQGTDGQVIYDLPVGSLTISPWFSPSGTYIQFEDNVAVCNQDLKLNLLVSNKEILQYNVYFEVISRGDILSVVPMKFPSTQSNDRLFSDDFIKNSSLAAQKNYNVLSVVFPVKITPAMAPRIHVIAYYTRSDREVIADERDFEITNCFANKVGFSFTEQKQFPGTDATAKITASADSYCGLLAVDKSVLLLSSGGRLTIDTLSEALEMFDLQSYVPNNENYCDFCDYGGGPGPFIQDEVARRRKRAINRRPIRPYPYYSSSTADSSRAFQNGRVAVMTDLVLNTKACVQRFCPIYFDRLDILEFDAGAVNEAGGAAPVVSSPAPGPMQQSGSPATQIRSDFSETFLWSLVQLSGTTGQVTQKLPDTITEWIGNAVCINTADGLGISPIANITAFKSIFVSFSLPYSVIRGETVSITISVFNYESKSVPVTLELTKTADFELKNGTSSATFCVNPGVSVTTVFLITPSKLGVVNLTATAKTIDDIKSCGSNPVSNVKTSDQVITPLLVEAEGYPHQDSANAFVCAEGGKFETTLTLVLPQPIVPDSLLVQASVTGDILGPTLKNIDQLIQMPTGCGEQNMIGFAPDVYISIYLKATGGLTADLSTKLIGYMQTGYQRELTYRRTDGSYSAFGQSDASGSIWLSAFVIQVYVAAKAFIFIDDVDVSTTGFWILNQQRDDGCFPLVGTVIHTDLIGGVGDATTSTVPLSAFIIASLIQAGQISGAKLTNGLNCLKKETNPALYSLALTTYALALAKDSTAADRFKDLMGKSVTTDGLTHWSDSGISASVLVEIASYAVLSVLELKGAGGASDALPIIRWLITQSNGNGGFISSQDTVIGIKALSRYASLVSQDPPDLTLTITSSADPAFNQAFKVNGDNKLLLQTVDLKADPKSLTFKGTGKGCVIVQYTLKYNVPVPANQKAFTLETQSTRSSKDCKTVSVSVCFSYTGTEANSGMVIVVIRPVSGYVADEGSLQMLLRDNSLALKRYDIDQNGVVTVYFDQATKDKKCFVFMVHQDNIVTDTKNGTVKIVDYYQTENFAAADMQIQGSCQ